MLQSHVESRRAKPLRMCQVHSNASGSFGIKTYIGNSRLSIEAIIVCIKERHAASGKNASGSFGIKECVWNSGLLAEATLQSPVESRRAKPL
uniref:Uncharacterized protein n=1 Tax=Cucumis sativus TaxID=3659 RepID=A0A0A0K7T7_CUCSA